MPPDLSQQLPYLRRFCAAMRISVLEIPGHEADDIIASVSTQALAAGLYPVVVTLDKDLYQLIDTILVLNTSKDDLIVDRERCPSSLGLIRNKFRTSSRLGATAREIFPARRDIVETARAS